MTIAPIEALGAIGGADPALAAGPLQAPAAAAGTGSFSQMLMSGVDTVNQKLLDAEALSAAFSVDDSVPLHRVTFALEEARLSFELMLQVRSRLLEGYQDIMRMSL